MLLFGQKKRSFRVWCLPTWSPERTMVMLAFVVFASYQINEWRLMAREVAAEQALASETQAVLELTRGHSRLVAPMTLSLYTSTPLQAVEAILGIEHVSHRRWSRRLLEKYHPSLILWPTESPLELPEGYKRGRTWQTIFGELQQVNPA